MSFVVDLLKKPPNFGDVSYVLRALLTRPLDLPGILRREAARRRIGKTIRPPDPLGVNVLTESWAAAAEAGVLNAPPGSGPTLILRAPLETTLPAAISALQRAGAVVFEGAADDPRLPYLSIEAARLGLAQWADEPDRLREARLDLAQTLAGSPRLRAALLDLASGPIGAR